MLLGLAITWAVMAPRAMGGLNLGAIGLAWKMVIAQFVAVNVQLWFKHEAARDRFGRFFAHQLLVAAVLGVGAAVSVVPAPLFSSGRSAVCSRGPVFYTLWAALCFWRMPELVGTTRPEFGRNAVADIQPFSTVMAPRHDTSPSGWISAKFMSLLQNILPSRGVSSQSPATLVPLRYEFSGGSRHRSPQVFGGRFRDRETGVGRSRPYAGLDGSARLYQVRRHGIRALAAIRLSAAAAASRADTGDRDLDGQTTALLARLFPRAEIVPVELPASDPILRETYDRGDREKLNKFHQTLAANTSAPNIRPVSANSFFIPAVVRPPFDLVLD